MRKFLALAALIGSINASAAEQSYLGVRCFSAPEGPTRSVSIFYKQHQEPGLFRPSYIEIYDVDPVVSQTCVMGANRTADQSDMPIRLWKTPDGCGAFEGPTSVKQLSEIEGTRETTPTGEKFDAVLKYDVGGNAGESSLTCRILPINAN
ncbi:MAG: hypothetical protein AB7T49_10745 [Oligoflexales bacterium]